MSNDQMMMRTAVAGLAKMSDRHLLHLFDYVYLPHLTPSTVLLQQCAAVCIQSFDFWKDGDGEESQ
jgi:hypothetical protein